MFKKVDIPILGLVQNMSLFTCPNCNHSTHIFGYENRVREMSDALGVKLLGDIPLHRSIGEDGDNGKPTVVAEPESERASVFKDIAQKTGNLVGLRMSSE